MLSASHTRESTFTSSPGPGRRKAKRWQRERIVLSSLAGSVVQSTKTTWGGGSSSVFSSALDASAVSECASSRM